MCVYHPSRAFSITIFNSEVKTRRPVFALFLGQAKSRAFGGIVESLHAYANMQLRHLKSPETSKNDFTCILIKQRNFTPVVPHLQLQIRVPHQKKK